MKGDVLDGISGAKSLSTTSWAANVGIWVNDALPKGTRERRFWLCEFTKLLCLNVSSLVAKAKESDPQSWWEQSEMQAQIPSAFLFFQNIFQMEALDLLCFSPGITQPCCHRSPASITVTQTALFPPGVNHCPCNSVML